MKSVKASFIAIAILLVAFVAVSPVQAGVSFSFFYSNLSPHGNWLVSAQYGRVWQPYDGGRGWNPYYDGHWVYADVGWTWVSDYEWGDVPYHYGTWFDDPAFGWVWVPGYVWAPAWVVFRTGPDYIGWAPVSPRFSIGASFGSGAADGPFLFVSSSHFCDPHIRSYVVSERRSRTIVNETRVVNNLAVERNIVVNRGPDPRMIEHASGRKVRQVSIESVPRAMPGRVVSRSAIAIEPGRMTHGLRAAQPASERQSLPASHPHSQGSGGSHVASAAPAPKTIAHRDPQPVPHGASPSPRPPAGNPQPSSAHGPKASHGKPKDHGKPHEANHHS